MERRKFLVGVGSLAAGSAAAMGTGAFTTVEAKRSLSVSVEGDASALLAIEKTDSPNSKYVTVNDDNSAISIDISTDYSEDGRDVQAEGLNVNAVTTIERLFKITNNGTQDVGVYMSNVPDGIGFSAGGDFANANQDYDGFVENKNNHFTESRHFSDGDFRGTNTEDGVPVLKPGQSVEAELFSYGGADVDVNQQVHIIAKETGKL